jgi:catechol 2,3-dioxygenase-like lactoylglutathione lyase family enzyme
MAVTLNHTIIPSADKRASAHFLADILGLPVGSPFGPFIPVPVGDTLTLDFAEVDAAIEPHHYAFAVDEAEFDQIFARIEAAGLKYYAEPHEPHGYGRINTSRGGRSVYFDDPNGHIMEVLTAPTP